MKIIIIIFSFTICSALFGQKTKVFRDDLGLQGEVKHEGEWNDTILPEKGKFNLKWREFNAEEDTLTTYTASGEIKDHQPENKWIWEEAGWDYFVEPGKTVKPEFKLQGKQAFWDGRFENGLPNGEWNYYYGAPFIDNRVKAKSSIRIKAHFKDGKMFNTFEIFDKRNDKRPVEIVGFCDENGVAEGIWLFEFFEDGSLIKETRVYKQGILLQIITQKDESIDTLNFDLAQQKIKVANGTSDRITIGEENFSSDGQVSQSQYLFKHLMNDYFLQGWDLKAFPYTVKRIAPVFKRFAYPLSVKEKSKRDSIENKLNLLENTVQSNLEMGNVFINRNRDEELDVAISTLELTSERTDVLKSLIAFSKEPDFLYFDRKNGQLNYWIDSINNMSVARGKAYPEAKNELYQVDLGDYLFNFFEIVLDLTKKMEKDLEPKLKQIESSFLALKREGELKELEDKMANQLMVLDSIYENKKGIGSHVHQYWVKNYFHESLKTYTNTKDYKKAKSLGRELLNKIDSLNAWEDEWSKIDSLNYTLTESYTNYAYNPYTGEHDIELIQKKKFINNVIDILVPYLKKEIVEAEDWNTFVLRHKRAKVLNMYLIEFSVLNERSDRRAERRIRREDNPERIRRILVNHMKNK